MKGNKKLYLILLASLSIFLSSCFKKDASPKLFTEDSYKSAELFVLCYKNFKIGAVLPDESYQLVNKDGLDAFYEYYKDELFSKDVINWESNFDCNRFSQYYAALAQIKYYKENFRTKRAKAIAIGEVYYHSDLLRGNHAINIIATKDGFIFLEPQTGEEIILTEKEKKSIFFIKI